MQPTGFTADGVLAPGDYEMTLDELRASILVVGTGASQAWDEAWRRRLVENLAVMAEQLWSASAHLRGWLLRRRQGPPQRHRWLQLPMWLVYRVELYPHFGQLCGIRDKWGNELEFPSAFRQSRRDSRPKGIVKLIRSRP